MDGGSGLLLTEYGFDLKNVSGSFDKNILYKYIDEHIPMLEEPRRDVIDAVISCVCSRNVQTILVEKKYIDEDYLDTYSRYYSKAFNQKASHCVRIHFFSESYSESDFFSEPAITPDHYLGFCIVRPTGNQFISRTVLAPPHPDSHDSYFLHARTEATSHILGVPHRVNGSPFIQQDINTFICAGAALWVVSHLMEKVGRARRFYPAEIGELAQKGLSHGQLRRGLTVEQIVMATRDMGFNPHIEAYNLDKIDDEDAHNRVVARICDYIHVAVDSGIPAILAYQLGPDDGHAVAVVGHDVVERLQLPGSHIVSEFNGYLRNSIFVENFYVMDDAKGPYQKFPVNKSQNNPLSIEACKSISVICPMPLEVTVEYGDVLPNLSMGSSRQWEQFFFSWKTVVECQFSP